MSNAKFSALNIYRLEAYYELLHTLRMPAFAIPTLIFPVAFYSVFALMLPGQWGSYQKALYLFGTYSVFGMMGPALFGFGVGLALERERGWLALKQVSPMPTGAYFFAKIVMSLIFALVVYLLLSVLALCVAKVELSLLQWLKILAVVLLGAAPFCALGLLIGSLARGQAAVAIVNLVYLPMSVLSGLWIPVFTFPALMQKFAVIWPSWHLSQMVLGLTGQVSGVRYGAHTLVLVLFAMLFLALAARFFSAGDGKQNSAHSRGLLGIALASAIGLVFALAPMMRGNATGAKPNTTNATAASNHYFIDNVRVFDGERVWPSADVHIDGGKIVAIAEQMKAPAAATVIDGQGKTLLPGLIDSHTHTYGNARSDALRFGVTTMLDMFTDLAAQPGFREQRDSLAQTRLADLYSAGMIATVKGGHGTQFGVRVPTLDTESSALPTLEAWVSARKAEGSDYIKLAVEDLSVYHATRRLPTLNEPTARDLIAAAHHQGLMALAHVSKQSSAKALTGFGVDGLVHIFQDAPADDSFINAAKAQGLFVIPTLSVVNGLSGDAAYQARNQALMQRYGARLSSEQRGSLQGGRAFMAAVHGSNARDSVARLHAAGVPILAGTDAPNPSTAHGLSMHQELVLLVAAGLKSDAALAAATSVPARLFGLKDRGRIAAGLRADLLLVDGDPISDIETTANIVRVFKNGYAVELEIAALRAAALDLDDGRYTLSLAEQADRGWQVTSDQMMGGTSKAELTRRARIAGELTGNSTTGSYGDEANDGVLQVQATALNGAPALWAGAIYLITSDMGAHDASTLKRLSFQARMLSSKEDKLQLMVFSGDQTRPTYHSVSIGKDWRTQSIDLTKIPGVNMSELRSIGFVRTEAGVSEFELAEIRLEP